MSAYLLRPPALLDYFPLCCRQLGEELLFSAYRVVAEMEGEEEGEVGWVMAVQ